MLVVKLMFFDCDQVAHLADHAQDLWRRFMLYWIVELLDAQGLDRFFLTLGPVDGAARLCNGNLTHDYED